VISRFTDVAEAIRRAPARCGSVRLVAIDGPGGAGKSVFAERLARHLCNAPVIHTDDFASWDNPVECWGRLEDEVLNPVERGEWPVRFRAYDWEARRLGEWREIPFSDAMRAQWEQWMAEEDAHFADDLAHDRADVIVDGAPSISHDPEEEFVVVAR
jgi:hypothetical protein